MNDPAKALTEMKKEKEFLICIDSDGCAFDTMEIKHKECFIPNTIRWWNLQAVSKYAREAAEYVNLYSKHRGINRFPALLEVFDLLSDRPEAVRRGYKVPEVPTLRKWAATETKLSSETLRQYVEAHPDDKVMAQTLVWSDNVNKTVTDIVKHVPPFPFTVDSLKAMQDKADVIVVSATPCEALEREWAEHDIAKYVKVIAGQEMGSKKEVIAAAKTKGYGDDRILMIGDAPGDYKAAVANGALFYPINPGNEEKSWENLCKKYLGVFFSGCYKGECEKKLLDEFDGYLPSSPWWKNKK